MSLIHKFLSLIRFSFANNTDYLLFFFELKGGCEITASTEKEDFSFKMNERSSFMLKLTCDENFNYKL